MAATAQAQAKLLYIVVVDDDGATFRYTRSLLHSTLQLMGCKPRHAFEISGRVFDEIRGHMAGGDMEDMPGGVQRYQLAADAEAASPRQFQFELYKRRTTLLLPRHLFLRLVCQALALYKYVAPDQRADLHRACRIRERKESVTILLCGTSGCGKSTLSTLLGSRLGITTVVSTDSIRHMMRSFVDEKQNPLLYASTYHAGECLDPVAVAEAKAKRKDKKRSGMSTTSATDYNTIKALNDKSDGKPIGKKQMAIEGYKAQSEMVIDSLDRLITAWEDRKESVVVEGVHLSLNFVGMFKLIQRLGSSRKLMAIVNVDGSVSKAWPVESSGADGKCTSENDSKKSVGDPIYGPLNIGRAESVNLQFGNFGISAWPTDAGGTSQAGIVNESRDNANEGTGSHVPSSSGSPKRLDGHCKEIKEPTAASSGSDVDDEEEEETAGAPPNSGSEGDLKDIRDIHEEMEGSVDEDCNRSDEEYDDLAMRDSMENGFLTDDGVVHTVLRQSSSNRLFDGNEQKHITLRKRHENLRTLSKVDLDFPDTARSSSSIGASSKRNGMRRWKRTLSDSFRSRPRSGSAPSLVDLASKNKGSAVPVAPDR
uniref:Zeta toxin domain-containing protein n=1 Tax=Leersia perrieri TaxID=77586 RepID=A0A0D9XH40_9ORYZ